MDNIQLKSVFEQLKELISDKLSRWFSDNSADSDAQTVEFLDENSDIETIVSDIIFYASKKTSNEEIKSLTNQLSEAISPDLTEKSKTIVNDIVGETVDIVRRENNPLLHPVLKNKLLSKVIELKTNISQDIETVTGELQATMKSLQDFNPEIFSQIEAVTDDVSQIEQIEKQDSNTILSVLNKEIVPQIKTVSKELTNYQNQILDEIDENIDAKVVEKTDIEQLQKDSPIRHTNKKLINKAGLNPTGTLNESLSLDSIIPTTNLSHISPTRKSTTGQRPNSTHVSVNKVNAHTAFYNSSVFHGISELS